MALGLVSHNASDLHNVLWWIVCKIKIQNRPKFFFFSLESNLILYLHTYKNSGYNEADGIPVSFLLFQPVHALGHHNLFFLSISEDTQGMSEACITVTVLQIVFGGRVGLLDFAL